MTLIDLRAGTFAAISAGTLTAIVIPLSIGVTSAEAVLEDGFGQPKEGHDA